MNANEQSDSSFRTDSNEHRQNENPPRKSNITIRSNDQRIEPRMFEFRIMGVPNSLDDDVIPFPISNYQ